MKIYTKTGDKGMSSLYNNQRRNKDDAFFEALGTTDELSSHIGVAMAALEESSLPLPLLSDQLEKIQCWLQDAGSSIATPIEGSNDVKLARTRFDASRTDQLEAWIDELDADLPRLTQFILPSGGLVSATLHVSRSVCRRAERCVQPLIRDEHCESSVGVFLNRLSDYLFTAARWAALKQGKEEKVYKK